MNAQLKKKQCIEEFNWLVYRDATLAGLAALLPVPYVDDMVEHHFRTSMIESIAARRNVELDSELIRHINRSPRTFIARMGKQARTLLLLPLRLPMRLITRVLRKFIYVLTARRAVAALSHYWRRAFLLDYIICAGYLDGNSAPSIAIDAMHQLLDDEQADPLTDLAVAAMRSAPGLPGMLFQLIRGQEAAHHGALESFRLFMEKHWPGFGAYFERLAMRYDARYAELVGVQTPAHGAVQEKSPSTLPPADQAVAR